MSLEPSFTMLLDDGRGAFPMAKPSGNIVDALERHLIPAVTDALRKAIREAVREMHGGGAGQTGQTH